MSIHEITHRMTPKEQEVFDIGYAKGKADAVKHREWIPVSERLPDKYGKYLTCDGKGNIHIFEHNPMGVYPFMIAPNSERYYQPTHWMPLPEPPQKG